jgi:prepilin-type N-terminal cleavage/methylation domain-containing protein/prepilin-type processing-associated H-X9-DG protein
MRHRACNAFTLVELLAVISIIAMLLAILMPSMARARQQGRGVVCQNNLRQMSITACVYTQNYDGFYPIAQYTQITPTGCVNYNWDFAVADEGGAKKLLPGILWQGQMIEKIQQCPSFKGQSNDPASPYTGYNYNTSYIGHGEGECIEIPVKSNAVKRAAGCALFGDGQWSGGANKFMRAPFKSDADRTFNARYAGTQGFRHLGTTNVAWADGHSSSSGKVYTVVEPAKQRALIDSYNRAAKDQNVGFLSPDNSAYDLE